MDNNTKVLLQLIAQNPGLPVVPMVDAEICGDDYGRYLGAWGSACVNEYILGKERVFMRDDGELEEPLVDAFGRAAYGQMTDTEVKHTFDALPWIKAIIVNIDMPKEDAP